MEYLLKQHIKLLLVVVSLILPPIAYAESPLYTVDAPYAASFDYGTVAFGAVTTNFASLIANASSHKWKALDCYNGLDKDVLISFDNSTTAGFIPSTKGKIMAFQSYGFYVNSPLYIKAVAGVASGSLYCVGIY